MFHNNSWRVDWPSPEKKNACNIVLDPQTEVKETGSFETNSECKKDFQLREKFSELFDFEWDLSILDFRNQASESLKWALKNQPTTVIRKFCQV